MWIDGGGGLQRGFVLVAAQSRRAKQAQSSGGIGDQITAESSLKKCSCYTVPVGTVGG